MPEADKSTTNLSGGVNKLLNELGGLGGIVLLVLPLGCVHYLKGIHHELCRGILPKIEKPEWDGNTCSVPNPVGETQTVLFPDAGLE